MGKWVHRIIEKDIKAGTGICSKCGPVNLKRRGRCENAVRAYKLKEKYGLSEDEVISFGLCEICKEKTALQVDHCHKTQKIRGFICGPCNRGLAGFRDNKKNLKAAIAYLG